ncbi:AAA family ATPase [Erysipelothrix rhusiopathiae]|nr:AAA family ATPase [Erysipelothrix rhusiopathiae]
MILDRISITNFRKFSNVASVQVDNNVLFVGKNNTGKTSVSELFRRFLSNSVTFSYEDFNSKCFNSSVIDGFYVDYLEAKTKDEFDFDTYFENFENLFPKILLDLEVKINDDDEIAQIKPFLYELSNNDIIIISCRFEMNNIKKTLCEYELYNEKIVKINEQQSVEENKIKSVSFSDFILRDLNTHYCKRYYSTKPSSDVKMLVNEEDVIKLFYIDYISARRDVDDTSDQKANNISLALWEYFSLNNSDEILNIDYLEKPKAQIRESLDDRYYKVFESLLKMMEDDVLLTKEYSLSISSDFDIESILKRNSKLKYLIDDISLSESSNGLGISNLVFIFVRIQLFLYNINQNEKTFNILFLEEPESHLHPQLQSTFFSKIVKPLVKDERIITMMSTHSSHILHNADIASIRYFTYNDHLKIKSLQDFLNENERFRKFIIKYFTLANCDLFFADKAILIEGMAERLLLPMFIRKNDEISEEYNLSKQNITTIEVGGRYANIFYDLLSFLELQTLIITDIDTVIGKSSCKCDISKEKKGSPTIKTSNPIIINWFVDEENNYIVDLVDKIKDKSLLIKNDDSNFSLRLAFQMPKTEEMEWGRTLEEQILIENLEIFAKDVKYNYTEDTEHDTNYLALCEAVRRLDNFEEFKIHEKDISEIKDYLFDNRYEIVGKIHKTDFSLDLIASNDDWIVPNYIKEGLIWLM